MLNIINVYKYYDRTPVLKGINLSISSQETVVIVGEKGSGKSTLLRCIDCSEPIDHGEIYFRGKKMISNDHLIGIIYPHYNLFPKKTLLENIVEVPIVFRHMNQAYAIKRAKTLLKAFQLEHKLFYYPEHLTPIDKQKAALVRSIIMDLRMIIWDDPVKIFERDAKAELLELIQQLKLYELTLGIVTDDKHFAEQIATRIVYLRDGKITQ